LPNLDHSEPEEVRPKEITLAEPGDMTGRPLAIFTLEGWKRDMGLSPNPNADFDLSLQELKSPAARNDTERHFSY
jgi:hypothetical protein